MSLERKVLDGLEQVREELEVDPQIVVDTDRRGPDAGDDWVRLCELVGEAATRVVTPLLGKPGTLLLTQPGLFARYRLEAPLHALREATQRDDGPGVFLIVPQFDQRGCTIDAPTGALAVPISSPAQCVHIADRWLTSTAGSSAPVS